MSTTDPFTAVMDDSEHSSLAPWVYAADRRTGLRRVRLDLATHGCSLFRMASPESADSEMQMGLDPDRIEALVDGIFAVAMTILVLDVHVPEFGPDTSDNALGAAVLHLVPKILGYASGFVILGTLWIGHRYQFHYIRRSDRTLLWINLVFLLAISFLPFVVALLGTYGARRLPCVLYGATLMVAGSCLLAQWQYAATGPSRLVRRDMRNEAFRALRNRIAIGIGGYGAGLILAFVMPRASLACYVAMPLVYLFPGRIDKHVKATR
jgi:uncharacterized membrane protein